MVESRGQGGLSVSTWIHTLSLNQTRNQSNGHYQPSHTEAPLFWHSPAFGQVFEVLSQLGPWLTLRTGLIFPQWALLWCVSPWRAWCWIPAHGWKSEREREERKKEMIHVTTELTSAVCQLLELIWRAIIIKGTVVKGCKIGFLQAKLIDCISLTKITGFSDKGNVVDLIYLVKNSFCCMGNTYWWHAEKHRYNCVIHREVRAGLPSTFSAAKEYQVWKEFRSVTSGLPERSVLHLI